MASRPGIAVHATALKELENVPLAARARAAIMDAILQNQFDGRLPSEDELAEMLNVSRTTVRAAVQDLEREGMIKRRRAVGTTIHRHIGSSVLALQRLVGFDYLLREQGHEVEVETSWEKRQVTPNVFPLPWDEAKDCCVLEKRYFADGEMALFVRDYIPWENLSETKIKEPIDASVFEFSKHYCRSPVDHAVVRLIPRVNGKDEVTMLDLEPDEPFLRLHETHYSDAAEVIGWSFVDVKSRYVTFEVFRGQ